MNNSLTLLTCPCHVIDPQKTPILVWIRKEKVLVKIANQHFVAIPRTDKNGETYWKCKDLVEASPQQEQVNNS